MIEGTKYSGASWTPDGHGFYYTWVPPIGGKVTIADRPGFAEVRFHKLGTDAGDRSDRPRGDAATRETFIGGGISRDGHWLIASIQHGWNSTDVYFKDARESRTRRGSTLVAGVDANFDVDVWRDQFYVLTNDGAPRYRVLQGRSRSTPSARRGRRSCPRATRRSRACGVVGEHLVADLPAQRGDRGRDPRPRRQARAQGRRCRRSAPSGGISGNPDEDTGYFSYTSFTEPQVIYKTSIKTGKVDEWARIKLPIDTARHGHRAGVLPVEGRHEAISMFLIHGKDAKQDGANPTILYGYGGFNVNMTPAFASSRAVWLERGGVYAIPNLRGGGEYGEDWHRAGMLLAQAERVRRLHRARPSS